MTFKDQIYFLTFSLEHLLLIDHSPLTPTYKDRGTLLYQKSLKKVQTLPLQKLKNKNNLFIKDQEKSKLQPLCIFELMILNFGLNIIDHAY